jgi:hypothetical protein
MTTGAVAKRTVGQRVHARGHIIADAIIGLTLASGVPAAVVSLSLSRMTSHLRKT